ncbi:hypothetical protein OKC48_20755 [Methylorubrum extorquens]|uniref:hypothetical protein n=1 Tax=Methylorubrum extorquens TaxID=408 RepID=UPI0022388502|nr:hypothetical protein [Methylorubrum extorquens]UYW25678.1 hypothetical protein OKC48_20755 [Methylorubrum extorquens]
MRYAVLAVVLVFCSNAAHARFDRSMCGDLAPTISNFADATGAAEKTTRGSNFDSMVRGTDGSLKAAAVRAQAARERVADSMRDYKAALEDLAYQLRVCAR